MLGTPVQTGVPSAFSVQEKRCGGEKRGGIEGEKAEKSWAEQGRGGRKKKFEKNKNSTCQIKKYVLLFISCQREILLLRYAAVAQLDRVFGYEPKGRGFESLLAYQKSRVHCARLFCLLCTERRISCDAHNVLTMYIQCHIIY